MAKYFSYSIAYKNHRVTLEKEKEIYSQHMTPDNAKLLIEFIESQFRADCVYHSHNIAIGYIDNGGRPFMVTGFNFDYKRNKKEREDVGMDWVETIQNDKLKAYLSSMSNRDLIVLTEITLNGKTQIDVAQRLGITRQTISKTHKRILADLRSLNLSEED